jgi:hypothetical protein
MLMLVKKIKSLTWPGLPLLLSLREVEHWYIYVKNQRVVFCPFPLTVSLTSSQHICFILAQQPRSTARHRDLYLTTHNTHNRQTSMPPVGFEPTILTDEQSQTYTLDRAAKGTGQYIINLTKSYQNRFTSPQFPITTKHQRTYTVTHRQLLSCNSITVALHSRGIFRMW